MSARSSWRGWLFAAAVLAATVSWLAGSSPQSRSAFQTLASLSLTSDAQGKALFTSVDLAPGQPVTACSQVQSSPVDGEVYLGLEGAAGNLLPYLDVVVAVGTGGLYGDCSQFHGTNVYSGGLAGLEQLAANGATGIDTGWSPATASSRSFEVTVSVADNNAAQGGQANGTLVWTLVAPGVGAAATTTAPTATTTRTQPTTTRPVMTQPATTRPATTRPSTTTGRPATTEPGTIAPPPAPSSTGPSSTGPSSTGPSSTGPVTMPTSQATAPRSSTPQPTTTIAAASAAGTATTSGAGSAPPGGVATATTASGVPSTTANSAPSTMTTATTTTTTTLPQPSGARTSKVRPPKPPSLLKQIMSTARRLATQARLPLTLFAVLAGFLFVQGRLDRKDPKLALAPMVAEPSLRFDDSSRPPRGARRLRAWRRSQTDHRGDR